MTAIITEQSAQFQLSTMKQNLVFVSDEMNNISVNYNHVKREFVFTDEKSISHFNSLGLNIEYTILRYVNFLQIMEDDIMLVSKFIGEGDRIKKYRKFSATVHQQINVLAHYLIKHFQLVKEMEDDVKEAYHRIENFSNEIFGDGFFNARTTSFDFIPLPKNN